MDKENLKDGQRIITANKPEGISLIDVTIFHFDKDYNLTEKLISKKVNIENNNWILSDVKFLKLYKDVFDKKDYDKYDLNSIYNYERSQQLFKNFDTMSFLDLIINYNSLIENGYNENFLNQSLHTLLSLPFFLF